MERDGRPGIPKPGEHGAWAVLYASFAVGWAAAGTGPNARILLLLIAVTGLFLAHEPFVKLLRSRRHGAPAENLRHWRTWLLIYLSLSMAGSAILLLIWRLWGLLGLGLLAAALFLAHLRLAFRRRDRSLAGELLGIAGLTLTAPAVEIAVSGQFEPRNLLVWASCILYFASGIFYVKMRVSHRLKPDLFPVRRNQCLAYHTILLLLVAAASIGLSLPALMLLGFVPVVVRAFWHGLRPTEGLDLKKIGYLEVAYTIFFSICTGAAWIIAS